jgi:hypothetical protein
MTAIPGVDYAWSHPGGAALKAAGKQFACRYLSPDSSKNLTRAEAADLAAHGIWAVVVWEGTAARAKAGKAAGVADAKTAAVQATTAGMPPSRPIYFAVDFDATSGDQTYINAYLDGAASVIGLARVGIYGGYYPVKRALDGGHATWAWQTTAWSGGQWDSRAVIRQGAQKTINGVSCDLNTATADDYGQWMPGKTPEADVALTAAEISKIADAVFAKFAAGGGVLESSDLDRVWNDDVIPAAAPPYNNSDYFAADGKTPNNVTWTPKYAQYAQAMGIRETLARVKGLEGAAGAVALTDAQIAALATQVASNTNLVTLIAEKVAEDIAARMAQ